MSEEEKQAYNYLEKYIEWETFGERNLEGDIKIILDLIKKLQKEIEDLKAVTRTYEAYKIGDDNKIVIASKEWFNNGCFEENYISKDKIKELIQNHEKFLSNELSKYDEDDIENRKAIQYASARLSFLLADIYKLGE